MLEEQATVVAVEQQRVWVEAVRRSQCESCSSKSSCQERTVMLVPEGHKTVRLEVENPYQLTVTLDDRVVVGIAENALVHASIQIYLFPLLLMVVAAVAGSVFALAEPLIILLAVVGLSIGFALVRWGGLSRYQQQRYRPILLKLLES